MKNRNTEYLGGKVGNLEKKSAKKKMEIKDKKSSEKKPSQYSSSFNTSI